MSAPALALVMIVKDGAADLARTLPTIAPSGGAA